MYLKQYRQLSCDHAEIVHGYDYYVILKEYLKSRYKGNNNKINLIVQRILQEIFKESLQVGDILQSISALTEYIGQLAERNHVETEHLSEILTFSSILESYSLPYELCSLYWSIASAAIRLADRGTSLHYIEKCEAQLKKCRNANLYAPDRFNELMANILHHKSMLGSAEAAIPLCEEALEYLNAIENHDTVSPSVDFYIGLFNSSIADNYLALGKYQESEKFSKIAIHHHRNAGDLRGEARTLITLAEICYRMGRKVEADKLADECLQKHIKVGQNITKVEKLLKELRTSDRRSLVARAVDWLR